MDSDRHGLPQPDTITAAKAELTLLAQQDS